jgi:peptidoglycan/xylan/chitin deacetylase (PgdA/CDA1 family)
MRYNFLRFPDGKTKALTLSYDDGCRQDLRFSDIVTKYGLKCTFNLTSAEACGNRALSVDEVKEYFLDKGHEIAVHTLTHPNLTQLDEAEVIRQVEEDRKALSSLCGYEVIGMAYPCGGVNNDDRVAEIIGKNTPIRYARTITSTHTFDLQKENRLRFNPSVYFIEDCFEAIVDKFLALETDEEQLLYIWGHTYEMDAEYISWENFERICKKLSNRADIFYGTNKEVLL